MTSDNTPLSTSQDNCSFITALSKNSPQMCNDELKNILTGAQTSAVQIQRLIKQLNNDIVSISHEHTPRFKLRTYRRT